ncbi:SIS domain-containing protein [Leptolyngbya sp. 7M]|uniref:SIS domain-containing protein n=1 Tax=Leptolyngbya sp. 7M TaxID=2812896 RepID=UPI001B8C439B|nr:SIS domain-containing protein [Leptolyngbya sp. 7M]QYO66631.1 SIS domain-containing protein [Leptolyngbya sp. 7M]
MLNEIYEQPEVLERTILAESSKVRRLADHLKRREINLIILVARGSSDNAAQFGRYLIETTTGIPVSLAAPSVFTIYKADLKLERALVVGISQSGEGSDINIVLERAKECGAFSIAITNNANSTMAQIADESLLVHAGPERSVAATKTYTGQMMCFYLLASALAPNNIAINKIPTFVNNTLELRSNIQNLVDRYVFMENCVVVGRGLNYGNAYELALKLMETCYVVAERFSSADLFHGPLAVIERRFPVIFFAPNGPTSKSNLLLSERLNELHADTLAITNDPRIGSISTCSILLSDEIDEILSPIPFIVPGQILAALLSEAKGLDPDKPRSLTKVTKTI